MISFILIFFFGAYVPFVDLEHQRENSFSDAILNDLAKLSKLTLQQENISKSIQNRLDTPTIAAINDYQRMDNYFMKLELLRSQALVSSNNLSASQLETILPTFYVCTQQFHMNIDSWVICNVERISDSTNKKIIIRYQPLARQIDPLVAKARENLIVFNMIAEPLIVEENKEILSRLPSTIAPESWKSSISNSLGLMKTLEANSNSVLNFVSRSDSTQSFAWDVLRNPSGLRLAYSDEHRKEFNNVVNLLNQSKNDIKNAMKALSDKFEEVEVPVLGKVPVGLANAVIIYPAAVGVGSLICSYYLGQTITRRKIFQEKSDAGHPIDHNLYPLWVDPLEKKKWIRYGRLLLFISVPVLILIAIAGFLHSSPIKDESMFGISENSILDVSVIIGFILTFIGIIIVLIREYQYRK